MIGCLLGVLTYFPLFKGLTHFSNPALEKFNASNTVTLTATDCQVHLFALPTTRYSDCDRVAEHPDHAQRVATTTSRPRPARPRT